MPFVCNIGEINRNYADAAARYAARKDQILERIKEEYNISGRDFINVIQSNYAQALKGKYTSASTSREVKLETLMQHLYNSVESIAASVLESHQGDDIQSQIQAIREKAQAAKKNAEQEQRLVNKEIENLVQQYVNEMNMESIIGQHLPAYVGGDNKKLSEAQVYAYVKSMLRKEINKRASIENIEKAVKRHPSIILGYVQEDALTDAILKAIEQFKMKTARAQTVGGEKTSVDVLITLGAKASSSANPGEVLSGILKQLDMIDGQISVLGESPLDSDSFLGIQSKPWKLYLPTTFWNRNSVGSRAELLAEFVTDNTFTPPDESGWHKGVLFLSQNLERVMGTNTVMYALGPELIWTSDLIKNLYTKHHKYFAFMLNSNNELTSHIHLADHYC